MIRLERLSMGVKFWSGGSVDARFLLHTGYMGAIGAWVGSSEIPTIGSH